MAHVAIFWSMSKCVMTWLSTNHLSNLKGIMCPTRIARGCFWCVYRYDQGNTGEREIYIISICFCAVYCYRSVGPAVRNHSSGDTSLSVSLCYHLLYYIIYLSHRTILILQVPFFVLPVLSTMSVSLPWLTRSLSLPPPPRPSLLSFSLPVPLLV